MKLRTTTNKGRSGIEIAGEALHLIRMAPPSALSSYFIGSAPFMLGLLYFWSDMSRSAFAGERCLTASLALTALFIWMKCWQSVFSAGLRSHLTGTPDTVWTFRSILRMVARQTTIQPYGLLLIPAAMFLLLPFYAVHSFFQNATTLEEGQDCDLSTFRRRAWRQSLTWPAQNHLIIWLLSPWTLAAGMLTVFGSVWLLMSFSPEMRGLAQELDSSDKLMVGIISIFLLYQFVLPVSPFGCMVAGNIAVTLVILPILLNFVFGVQSSFGMSGIHGIMNTTFLITVYALSYLCLDPILKAAHVLRCFYGESQQTGQDLLLDLHAATLTKAAP